MYDRKQNLIEVCQFYKEHQLNAELVGRWVGGARAPSDSEDTQHVPSENGRRRRVFSLQ